MPPYHFGDPLIYIVIERCSTPVPSTQNRWISGSADQLQAFGAVDAGLVLAPCHDKVWRREDEARLLASLNSSGSSHDVFFWLKVSTR